jgi:hypothetical protein
MMVSVFAESQLDHPTIAILMLMPILKKLKPPNTPLNASTALCISARHVAVG